MILWHCHSVMFLKPGKLFIQRPSNFWIRDFRSQFFGGVRPSGASSFAEFARHGEDLRPTISMNGFDLDRCAALQ